MAGRPADLQGTYHRGYRVGGDPQNPSCHALASIPSHRTGWPYARHRRPL